MYLKGHQVYHHLYFNKTIPLECVLWNDFAAESSPVAE